MSKAAVYHFTNKSDKRPVYYQNQIIKLKEFAESIGYNTLDIYCDMSLNKSEHTEFSRFMDNCQEYDALIVKDFYHICKNTKECMKILNFLQNNSVNIYSMDNGSFIFEDIPDKPLKAVSYCSRFGTLSSSNNIIFVQNDIIKLYISKKTNWKLIDMYSDESKVQRDEEQRELKKLIKNKDSYDILVIHNLNDIHWRTSNFCKIREQLKMDIYSLQDGYLPYRKG